MLTSLLSHSRALRRYSATRMQSRMAIASRESILVSDGKRRSRYSASTCPCLQDPQRQSRSAAASRSENVRHFVDMTRGTAGRISTSIVLSFEGRLYWVDDISQACSHRHPFSRPLEPSACKDGLRPAHLRASWQAITPAMQLKTE